MTVEQFQHALHISDDQLRNLRILTESLGKFDRELAAASPDAQTLAGPAVENQLLQCAELMAKLLGVTPEEALKLINKLLGSDVITPLTTGGLSGMILSYLIRKLNP